MTRTAHQFVSRESMYPMTDETFPVPEMNADARPSAHQKSQKEQTTVKLRKTKGPSWMPLDLKATEESPAVNTWNSDWPPPSGRTLQNSTPSAKPQKKRRHRPRKPRAKPTMQDLPKSVLVPPHLRKGNSEPSATPDSGQATNTALCASAAAASSKAKLTHTSDPSQQDAPNGAGLPLSPPTTPREAEKANFENGENEGWPDRDNTQPGPPLVATKRNSPRRPGGTKAPHRKFVWPKNRDMKAPSNPSTYDGGVECRSNSNGDPDYDIKKLVDWNGDWLPPPPEWGTRQGFTNRHGSEAIEQWMNGHSGDCLKVMDISSPAFTEDGSCKELVPRHWTTSIIEHKSLGEFWKNMPNSAPSAVSDVDIMADPPYWERYEHPNSSYIDGLGAPTAPLDPNDLENHVAGPTGMASATEKVQALHRDRQEAHRRRLAKQMRPVRETLHAGQTLDDRRIVPGFNVYIRPVQAADVRGIAEIYNYYIEHTIFANEFDPRTEAQMRDRINAITTQGLPFLVAVSRGNKSRDNVGYISERIVGYISLDDYCDQRSMYRFTFDMDLYVHPGFVSHKIAQCLLDKMLEMANTGYDSRGGYEYQNNFEYLKIGPARVIKTITLTVHLEHGKKDDKVSEYLKQFHFHRAGHVQTVGFKLHKEIDSFLYQHHTTERINPSSFPTVPLNLV